MDDKPKDPIAEAILEAQLKIKAAGTETLLDKLQLLEMRLSSDCIDVYTKYTDELQDIMPSNPDDMANVSQECLFIAVRISKRLMSYYKQLIEQVDERED